MKELVVKLKKQGVLKTSVIIEAFLACDRKKFVPKEMRLEAYVDAPLPIGFGQTISQPYTVAFMIELLQPQEGQKILDVGFGSGWTTAILAKIVGPGGKVYGIEIIPEVYEFGKKNLAKFEYQNLELYNQNGWEGLPEKAPFERILVSAAAEEIPNKLKEQLAVGGRIVVPVGGNAFLFGQSIMLLKKIGRNEFEEENYPGFAFVPLLK